MDRLEVPPRQRLHRREPAARRATRRGWRRRQGHRCAAALVVLVEPLDRLRLPPVVGRRVVDRHVEEERRGRQRGERGEVGQQGGRAGVGEQADVGRVEGRAAARQQRRAARRQRRAAGVGRVWDWDRDPVPERHHSPQVRAARRKPPNARLSSIRLAIARGRSCCDLASWQANPTPKNCGEMVRFDRAKARRSRSTPRTRRRGRATRRRGSRTTSTGSSRRSPLARLPQRARPPGASEGALPHSYIPRPPKHGRSLGNPARLRVPPSLQRYNSPPKGRGAGSEASLAAAAEGADRASSPPSYQHVRRAGPVAKA